MIISPCFQGSKDQLEGVWEETDKMDPEDFDPKTFFKFHGMWDFIWVPLYMGRAKRIWYLSPMRAAKVQASLRIRAVSPEPPLLAHTSSESRGTFRQKARSLAPLNGWACAVTICHDGMLEDTNSLDGAHMLYSCVFYNLRSAYWKYDRPAI